MFPVSVLHRRNSHNAREHSRKIILVKDAQFSSYLVDSEGCELQILTGVLDLQVIEINYRGVARLLAEQAGIMGYG